MDKADRGRNIDQVRDEDFKRQKEELKRQHDIKMNQLKKQFERLQTKNQKNYELELAQKEKNLESLRTHRLVYQKQEEDLIDNISKLRAHKNRFSEIKGNQDIRMREISKLEKEARDVENDLKKREQAYRLIKTRQLKFDHLFSENAQLKKKRDELNYQNDLLLQEKAQIEQENQYLHKELVNKQDTFSSQFEKQQREKTDENDRLKGEIGNILREKEDINNQIVNVFYQNNQEEEKFKKSLRDKKINYEQQILEREEIINQLKQK